VVAGPVDSSTATPRITWEAGSQSFENDTLGASKSSVGGQSQYLADPKLSLDDLVDFYIDLFAQQGHRNIGVICGKNEDGSDPRARRLEAVKWAGDYGYMVSITIREHVVPNSEYTFADGGGPTDPHLVWVQVNGGKNFFEGTNESPALNCPFDLDRMTNVLQPYGLKPFRTPKGWVPPHKPLGSKDDYRTTPPIINPAFPATATTIDTSKQ
jgi:hypothetical protein